MGTVEFRKCGNANSRRQWFNKSDFVLRIFDFGVLVLRALAQASQLSGLSPTQPHLELLQPRRRT